MYALARVLVKIIPLLIILIASCKKDSANIAISFCNGGMVPDSVYFMETNLNGNDYIWQLFSVNGTALTTAQSTGSVNTAVIRFDSAGTYRVKVDVDNAQTAEVSFTLRDYIAEGAQRGVSFFDSDLIVWTVDPDSDCRAAVRVKQPNGEGGIDFYQAENKIIYTPFTIISCFPNGEDLEEVSSDRFSLRDLVIEQATGKVFLGAFDDDTGDDVILETTIPNIPALANNQFTTRYPVSENIDQLTYNPVSRIFYFVNEKATIKIREAVDGAGTTEETFGSQEEKSAVVFDIGRQRLIFGEGVFDCSIVIVDPSKPGQRETVFSVPCDGRINGIDLDESTRDLVYTDGENVWMVNLSATTSFIPLILSNDRTMRKDDITFDREVSPPIFDVVIAQYKD